MTLEQEKIEKAEQCAKQLVQDLLELSDTDNKALAVLTDQLILKAAEIRNTLERLQ